MGGHVSCGESITDAVKRELEEEIGVTLKDGGEISFFYTIKVRNDFESENITSFRLTHSGPFVMQEDEVDELEFFSPDELKELLASSPEIFTPLLQRELKEYILR